MRGSLGSESFPHLAIEVGENFMLDSVLLGELLEPLDGVVLGRANRKPLNILRLVLGCQLLDLLGLVQRLHRRTPGFGPLQHDVLVLEIRRFEGFAIEIFQIEGQLGSLLDTFIVGLQRSTTAQAERQSQDRCDNSHQPLPFHLQQRLGLLSSSTYFGFFSCGPSSVTAGIDSVPV